MVALNKLEQAILNWVSEHTSNLSLKKQLTTAQLRKREWTKVGFYVLIDVDHSLGRADVNFPVRGPDIESKDIEYGGGSLIWGKDGFANAIELYANGSFFKEPLSEFKLQ